MNKPMVFENMSLGSVRVVEANGELWFVAKDVALALEYPEISINQPNNLFSHVPDEWTTHNPIMVRSNNGVEQKRDMLCLSEQGLYFFLGRSDKPKALPYQKWIAGDVMPSIRKTGSYSIANQHNELMSELDIAKFILEAAGLNKNQVALGLDNISKKRIGKSLLQESQIALPAPVQKAMLTPTEIGLELGGISNRKVNKILIDKGYQKRLANGKLELTEQGLPYGVMLDTGKRRGGTPIIQLKWYSTIIDLIR